MADHRAGDGMVQKYFGKVLLTWQMEVMHKLKPHWASYSKTGVLTIGFHGIKTRYLYIEVDREKTPCKKTQQSSPLEAIQQRFRL